MNLGEPKWYGQLRLTGTAKPIESQGSPASILKEFVAYMTQANPRELVGGKSFTFSFSSVPFPDASILAQQKRISEVESGLEVPSDSDMGRPREGESYETYHDRLIVEGYDPNTAEFLANDWFERTQNPKLTQWLSDPKAALFRKLNSSHTAFSEAAPSEYAALKAYVQAEFPEFCEHINFMTA